MSFFGSSVPRDVKLMSKAINKVDDETLQKILQLVKGSLEGKKVAEGVMERAFGDDVNETEREQISVVTAGLLTTIKAVVRLPETKLKKESLREDLEELKLSNEVIERLTEIVFGESYKKMNRCLVLQHPKLPTLKQFTWRLDVSISTSSLSRVFEPTIVVKLVLSNGTVRNFEMSLKRFHQLRCNVAIVLREMEQLEKRNAIRSLQ